MSKPRITVIAGPTASGKTACAVALCRMAGGEVVSADSMQLYRRMDIGTAKPSEAEKMGVTHHMIDVLEPSQACSAAMYREMAKPIVDGIRARGRLPVLCGGTGLYIDALTKPMRFSIQGDESVRNRLESLLEERGREFIHDRLRSVDPDSAQRLHSNDTRRVIRALEIYELTGVTLTEHNRRDALREGDYEAEMFAPDWPRDVLYARIDRRVDEMMRQGLADEVEALLREDGVRASTAMQAIGYKEIADALDGRCTMAEAVVRIKQGTRNYAKRQLTWFRRDTRVQWIKAEGRDAEDISREIMERMKEKE